MLNQYLQRTQQLIQDPKQTVLTPLFLTSWINEARRQIAGEAECIRVLGALSTNVSQRAYSFANITLNASVIGPLNVRSMLYDVGSGQQWVTPRNWEWFQLYAMNTPVPASGPPTMWSQFAQGATGSFYIDPLPDIAYTLTLDCVCYPIDLVTDGTAETIPVLWTDAVSYFAAYLAYLYLQNKDAAQNMMNLYEMFMQRARKAANPSVNRWMYQQSPDPTMISKLGLQQKNAQ